MGRLFGTGMALDVLGTHEPAKQVSVEARMRRSRSPPWYTLAAYPLYGEALVRLR